MRDAAQDVAHDAARDVATSPRTIILRTMLRMTVALVRDALQPVLPNLSCRILLSTSLVHICAEPGCARRLAVLVADLNTTFALQVAFFGLEEV